MPKRFDQAVRALPAGLRRQLSALPDEQKAVTEEIRLRSGSPVRLVTTGGELALSQELLEARDLAQVLESAIQGSLHTYLEPLRHGFVTVQGGHRIGICGTATIKDGQLSHVRDISSMNLRIARERRGIADKVLPRLLKNGKLPHTLVLSPPGVGKTTLLRDLVRLISDGSELLAPLRVSVADERGEIAASYGGQPQLEVGAHTDVWSGMGKAQAAMMLLRSMSPQVLVMDEITAPEDIAAIEMSVGCGVTVLSSAHAARMEDLSRRPVYRAISDIFSRIVLISGAGGTRSYQIQEVSRVCAPL